MLWLIDMGKLILGYWNLRGKGERVRLMLEYLGLNYENVIYHFGGLPDCDQSEWLNVKFKLGLDFPNLPYIIDGDIKMTESWAIMRYLAHKNNNQLYPEPGKQEILCEVSAGVVHDFRTKFMLMIYNKEFETSKQDYEKALPAKLDQFESFLADKSWLAGDKLTFVDFAFCETLDRHVMMYPACLDNHKNLKRYFETFQNLEPIKDYHQSSRFKKYPLHKSTAMWGHGP